MAESKKFVTISVELLEQMFCEGEGILSKFSEVDENTIGEWIEEKRQYMDTEAEDMITKIEERTINQ